MERILVVEGDRGIQMLYEAELTDEGYEVLTYGHGDMLMQTEEIPVIFSTAHPHSHSIRNTGTQTASWKKARI